MPVTGGVRKALDSLNKPGQLTEGQNDRTTEGPRTGFPGSDVGLETARVR